MATSSPPSKAKFDWASPHTAHSDDVPLSHALNFIEELANHGVVLAPSMPEAEAIQAAAIQNGITPKQALQAYLTIVGYE